MYNGIGLRTVRGTATSGYVQRNLGYVQPERRGRWDGSTSSTTPPPHTLRKFDKELVDHEERRSIELKVIELEDELKSKGESDTSIQQQCTNLRNDLLAQLSKRYKEQKERKKKERKQRKAVASGLDRGEQAVTRDTKRQRPNEVRKPLNTHMEAVKVREKDEKLREVFGIGESHRVGEAFDRDAQKKKREERKRERQKREKQEARQAKAAREEKRSKQRAERKQLRRMIEEKEDGEISETESGSSRRKRKRSRRSRSYSSSSSSSTSSSSSSASSDSSSSSSSSGSDSESTASSRSTRR